MDGGRFFPKHQGRTQVPTAAPASSGSARRMRRHRARKKQGVRCFQIRVSNETLDVFVRRGYLSQTRRQDPDAIEAAFYALCNVGLSR
jgi:hypothetical protein